jgi:hypothetical protein
MRRRLLAISAMVALATVTSGTAALAAPGVRFVQPPTPAKDQAVKGVQSIEAVAEPPSVLGLGLVGPTVKSITVTIRPRSGFKAGAPVAATKEGPNFKMTWSTNESTPYNGGYDLEAVATLSDSTTMKGTVENVVVNNPASAPSGVKAGLEGGSAVVRWSENSEPDITSYKVSRSVEGGSFTHLASIESGKTLAFTDAQAPVGKPLKYQVAAVRRSAVTDGGLVSEPAESSEVTIPVPADQQPGQVAGQPTDASGAPVTPTLPLAAPIAGPTMAPTLPVAKKAAPPPIYKSRPSEIAFAPTLPFSGLPPEKFDTPEEEPESDLAAPSGLADSFTATNPSRFIAIGIVLLGASFFLFRTSRRILKAEGMTLLADDFLTGADFSSLGEIELPPVEIAYPTFKVDPELTTFGGQAPGIPPGQAGPKSKDA